MTPAEIVDMTRTYQMGNYARHPVAFVRGEGARLFDAGGHRRSLAVIAPKVNDANA